MTLEQIKNNFERMKKIGEQQREQVKRLLATSATPTVTEETNIQIKKEESQSPPVAEPSPQSPTPSLPPKEQQVIPPTPVISAPTPVISPVLPPTPTPVLPPTPTPVLPPTPTPVTSPVLPPTPVTSPVLPPPPVISPVLPPPVIPPKEQQQTLPPEQLQPTTPLGDKSSLLTPVKEEHPSSSSSSSSFGSPSDVPLSIQLESETLQKYQSRLPFRSYLENGYRKYRLWLSMTLGSTYSQHLNFCVARNMNQLSKSHVMGLDLEVRYILKRLEHLFGVSDMKYYENVIHNTLKQNLELSDIHIQSTIDSYMRNPMSFELSLSDQEFDKRLGNVPTNELDQHSFKCWRNFNHVKLNENPYPITHEDILSGESLAPPSGAHLGLQMLEMYGYLPPMVRPRKARSYGVTFI
jgi:hypothetical protein